MFTLRVMIFKMSKIAIFFADNIKKFVTVWATYLSTHGRSYRVLEENDMVDRLWIWTVREILRINIKKIAKSRKRYQNPVFLNVEILLMVAQNYIIYSIFQNG